MTIQQKSSFLLKSYGNLWLLYIAFSILISIITYWFPNIIDSQYKQTDIIEMAKSNPFQLFMLACILAPIVEEMMFRTLIKPSHSDLILFVCSWIIFIGGAFFSNTLYWFLKFIFSLILLYSLHTILKQLIPEEQTVKLRNILSQFTLPILIISAIIFGLVHISNYVTDVTFNIHLLILVIPQIIAGFVLGIVKKKNKNLAWPIGLHFMNNIVPVTIIILGNPLS